MSVAEIVEAAGLVEYIVRALIVVAHEKRKWRLYEHLASELFCWCCVSVFLWGHCCDHDVKLC